MAGPIPGAPRTVKTRRPSIPKAVEGKVRLHHARHPTTRERRAKPHSLIERDRELHLHHDPSKRVHTMSSTNRGGRRSPADYYPTPAWCVERLLEEAELPGGLWAEPCAGDGAIIRAVKAVRPGIEWCANELRPECSNELLPLVANGELALGDARGWSPRSRPTVAITNPPFRLAMEMVEWSRENADVAVLLLRLNFVGTASRAPFMRTCPPDVYVLPNRPSFTGRGTDSIEYAWFVWDSRRPQSEFGRLCVLRPTPPEQRRSSLPT